MSPGDKAPPPADQPDWGAPYNWHWFKVHHLTTLERHAQALDALYKAHPAGEPFQARHVAALLVPLDGLATLDDWLPDGEGGRGAMDKILRARQGLRDALGGSREAPVSHWQVQELNLAVCGLVDYMQAMCEDE